MSMSNLHAANTPHLQVYPCFICTAVICSAESSSSTAELISNQSLAFKRIKEKAESSQMPQLCPPPVHKTTSSLASRSPNVSHFSYHCLLHAATHLYILLRHLMCLSYHFLHWRIVLYLLFLFPGHFYFVHFGWHPHTVLGVMARFLSTSDLETSSLFILSFNYCNYIFKTKYIFLFSCRSAAPHLH